MLRSRCGIVYQGSIHFWKKHNSCTPKTLLYGSSKKVYPPKVDAPFINVNPQILSSIYT